MNLVMLNYRVEPRLLLDRVPDGTELDFFEGETYISLVAFQFLDTRLLGVPVPFHRNFEEINLRFYVRRELEGETRRGVVFLKEIVPRRAIALVANLVYNESYVTMHTAHHATVGAGGARRLIYEWGHRSPSPASIEIEIRGEPQLHGAGTVESFITEHYWGYVEQRDGGTLEYEVVHPAWKVWHAERTRLVCDAARLYGEELAAELSREPDTAFLTEGSSVAVLRGRRI